MRLLELRVRNVRGIRDERLSPEGGNMLVWGPNGAGKSAVVDAIDFLLTGSITRLTGRGTGGISLPAHGAHIDADVAESYVEAKLSVPSLDAPVTIRRSLATPSTIELSDESVRPTVAPLLALAEKGQHLLTRRDILTFITSEAGTRAELIQDLLDFGPLEQIRRALVRIKSETRQALEAAEGTYATALGRLVTHAGLSNYDEGAVLAHVNHQRETLGASPISRLGASLVRANVPRPTGDDAAVADPSRLSNAAMSVRGLISGAEELAEMQQDTEQMLTRLSEDPEMLQELEVADLLKRGLALLPQDGSCPLCGADHPEDQLEGRLRSRLERAEEASRTSDRLDQVARKLREMAGTLAGVLESCLEVLELAGEPELATRIREWRADVERAAETYALPDIDELEKWSPATVSALMTEEHESLLGEIEETALAMAPVVSPPSAAWDELTQLEEALHALEHAESTRRVADLTHQRADELHRRYGAARDEAVQATYDAIRERFEDLYRELHGHEEHFSSSLEPAGAGLDLRVDFYGRGLHPPHALHSEGHQDSMGVCLFLALTERLTSGAVDIIMLDDVIMSVDADHRRALAGLLASAFPHRQLIITTHDRSWQGQLVTEGVVTNKNSYHFSDWSVELGPRLTGTTSLWDRIAADLETDDVPSAAAKLRRGAEDFLAQVCDRLGAPVRYRLDGALELGDLTRGAMHRLRRLTKDGKDAAQSWGEQEAHEWLVEFGSIAGQIFERTNAERWAVNASVHYNGWADLSAEDFRPVVDAFADLFELFMCGNCGSLLETSYAGPIEKRVDCRCGQVGWTLESRE